MKKNTKNNRRREFTRQFYKGNGGLIFLAMVRMVLSIAGNLMISWLMQVLVDASNGSGPWTATELLMLCLADIALIALSCWLTWVSFPKMISRAMSQYKNAVFAKLSRKNISAFSGENTALYISALTNDAATIEVDFLCDLFNGLLDVLMLVGALALMLWYNPTLTAISILLALLPMAVSLAAGNRVAEAERIVSQKNEGYVSTVKDCLNGFSVMKSFRAEEAMCRMFAREVNAVYEAKARRRQVSISVQSTGMIAGLIAQLGVFLIGVWMIQAGKGLSGGMLIAFVNLMNMVVNPIGTIPQYIAQWKAANALMDKLADALDRNIRQEGLEHKTGLTSTIALTDLSFAYDAEKPVLQDVNFTFEAGKRYAIVGASGCGKSTLLNLLMASHNGYTGSIRYDDAELRQISSESLYEMVSVVQQNVFIFNASIRDNITMFSDFPREEVDRAIALSGLSALIAERGEGYLCGENGCGLSGGEKQRISIARSLLKKSQVLLVDEATAALDAQTAFQVSNAILDLQGLTCIVVTHGLDEHLLKRYDCILALKNGSIAESGSFRELMEQKGYFYSLFTVSQ